MTLLYIYIHFFSSIVYIEHLCDVYVELRSHVFTAAAAADNLRAKIAPDLHAQIKGWLMNGPSPELRLTIQQAVQERRKQLQRFLRVGYTDSDIPTATPDLDVFNQFLAPQYECDTIQVASEADLFTAIGDFLGGAARDVDVPVILVTGKGQKQDDKLMLHFGETRASAGHILSHCKDENWIKYKGNNQLRMVFCCYDNESDEKVWFSHVPPKVKDSKIQEFYWYHKEIVGDGPKNKNIQLPD